MTAAGDRYCIIGAGPAGLAAAHAFIKRGLAFDCLEREADIGGVWNFHGPGGRVHHATKMISSKENAAFRGFPMPADYPTFPDHFSLLRYLRHFSDATGATQTIAFRKEVVHLSHSEGRWNVGLRDEAQPRSYRGVVIATGHHREPNLPAWHDAPGCPVIHSSAYKSAEQVAGKRILVVGSGNSGCDISADAVANALSVDHSMRSGVYIFPRRLLGQPIDVVFNRAENLRLPPSIKKAVYDWALKLTFGSPERYGLPRPEHGILDRHPTINDEFPLLVRAGKIRIRKDVKCARGKTIVFEDDSVGEYDLVIAATGYNSGFPQWVKDGIPDAGGKPFIMNIFHPMWNGLYAIGSFQTNGGFWPLMNWQAHAVAGVESVRRNGSDADMTKVKSQVESFNRMHRRANLQPPGSIQLEIDYIRYKKLIKELSKHTWRAGVRLAAA